MASEDQIQRLVLETFVIQTLNWVNSFSISFYLLSEDQFNLQKYVNQLSQFFIIINHNSMICHCNFLFFVWILQDFDKLWPIFDSVQSRDFRKVWIFYFLFWCDVNLNRMLWNGYERCGGMCLIGCASDY